MKLSIIIVNWNTADLLKKCIKSIFNYGKNVDVELIVIDNASIDDSQQTIKQLSNLTDKPFKIILNNQNLGFARAVNQGLKTAKGEYVLLLNPDTEIKEKTLEKAINFISSDEKNGILGGKILNLDGTVQPSVRSFPTFSSQSLILLKSHHFFKTQALRKYFALNFDYSKTQEVDQVMGAFFLIRKRVIEEIGFFDEKFFIWFEEVDFCKRAKDIGWKVVYYPGAEIIHCGGASFSQNPSIKNQWQFNKSLLYYFKKHHSFFAYLLLLFITPISLFLSLITSIFPHFRKFKKL